MLVTDAARRASQGTRSAARSTLDFSHGRLRERTNRPSIRCRRAAHSARSATILGNGGRLAYEVRPAVAIVDQWMPGMTGAEVIRLLRAAPGVEVRSMAIVGLSGRPGSERDLLGAGAASFLAKPFGEAELAAKMAAALGDGGPAPGAA
ncbi:MAG TPA: response regulator [Anaeromyxobacter sp.]